MTVVPFVILAQGPGPWMGPSPDQLEFVRRIAESFFTMVAVIALGVPLIRLVGRRLERPLPSAAPAARSADTTARLERIEQAVDSIAIEMERVSEAQRFAAKLMADGAARALPPPRPVEHGKPSPLSGHHDSPALLPLPPPSTCPAS